MANIWTTGGNLNTARTNLAAAGSQIAGLCFGGANAAEEISAVTEEYDGSAWSAGGALATARKYIAGAGTQTAGLSMGGNTTVTVNVTEEYDGAAWSGGGNLPVRIGESAGCGTQTAGLNFGGYIGGVTNDTSEYDGNSWSGGGDLATAREDLGSCGTQTAGLSIAGWTGAHTSAVCEEYNGTAWSAGAAVSVARYAIGASGSQTAGLCFGGVNEADVKVVLTEEYNGTSWVTGGNLGTAKSSANGGCGVQNAALSMGGRTAGGISSLTEEYLTPPTVTTQAVSSITATSFVGNGTITDVGGANATVRGFCYLLDSPTKREYCSTGYNNYVATQTTTWRGQVFTAASNHSVSSVKLYLRKYGTVIGTVTVSLNTVSGSNPTQTILASGTFDGDTVLTTSLAWIEIPMNTEVELVSGTKYAIVCSAPSSDANGAGYGCAENNSGTSGMRASLDSGVNWSNHDPADTDSYFEVWGNNTPTTSDSIVYDTADPYSLALVATSSQYASITDAAQTGLDLSTAFTMEFWIKPVAIDISYGIIGKNGETAAFAYSVFADNSNTNKLDVTVSDNGAFATGHLVKFRSDSAVFEAGVWVHLAVSISMNNGAAPTCVMYKNGSPVTNSIYYGTTSGASIYNNPDDFVLGAALNMVGGYVDGLIDEVRIWNDVRTAQEIIDHYNKSLVGNEAGLVAYWKLDNNYLDETANNNDLTASGSPTFSSSTPSTFGYTAEAFTHIID